MSSWQSQQKSYRMFMWNFMWQVHLGIIHFNNEFYARSKCQRRMFNCCQKWGFLSRSAAHCSSLTSGPARHKHSQEITVLVRPLYLVPIPGPAPSLALSHQWSEVASSRRLEPVIRLKSRQNSVIILSSEWWAGDSSQSQYRVIQCHWHISISSQVHEKVLQPHLEVLMRFKCSEINWDGMQGLVSERIWSGLASCGHLYRLPSHNENVKRSTIAKDPRGHFHDAFIHVSQFWIK